MHLADTLSKATYSAFRLYIFFYQYVCSLGIEPTTFSAANAYMCDANVQKHQFSNLPAY